MYSVILRPQVIFFFYDADIKIIFLTNLDSERTRIKIKKKTHTRVYKEHNLYM